MQSQSKSDGTYIYAIGEVGGDCIKIGKSVKPEQRINSLSTGTPRELELLAKTNVENGTKAERELHEKYDQHRKSGEWFEAVGEVKEDILRDIEQYNEDTQKNNDSNQEITEKDRSRYKSMHRLFNDLDSGGERPDEFTGLNDYLEPFKVPSCGICDRRVVSDKYGDMMTVENDVVLCPQCWWCYIFGHVSDGQEKEYAHKARKLRLKSDDSFSSIQSMSNINAGDQIYITNKWLLDLRRHFVLSSGPEFVSVTSLTPADMFDENGELVVETYRLSKKSDSWFGLSFLELLRRGRVFKDFNNSRSVQEIINEYRKVVIE